MSTGCDKVFGTCPTGTQLLVPRNVTSIIMVAMDTITMAYYLIWSSKYGEPNI